VPGRGIAGIAIGRDHDLPGQDVTAIGRDAVARALPPQPVDGHATHQLRAQLAGGLGQAAHIQAGVQGARALDQQAAVIQLGRHFRVHLGAFQDGRGVLPGAVEHLSPALQRLQRLRRVGADEAAGAAVEATDALALQEGVEIVEGGLGFLDHFFQQLGIQRLVQVCPRPAEAAGTGERAAIAGGRTPANGLAVQHHGLHPAAAQLDGRAQPGDAAADHDHLRALGHRRRPFGRRGGRRQLPPIGLLDKARGQDAKVHAHARRLACVRRGWVPLLWLCDPTLVMTDG
jgi:hypothetical protein